MSNDLTLSKTTISQPTTSITPSISQQGQKNTLIQYNGPLVKTTF
nr:MAG TPA: hypothetical protein [Bacteriophage sp.]